MSCHYIEKYDIGDKQRRGQDRRLRKRVEGLKCTKGMWLQIQRIQGDKVKEFLSEVLVPEEIEVGAIAVVVVEARKGKNPSQQVCCPPGQ
jgi:hypothetical protein